MPTNVVKTPRQERLWERAKQIVQREMQLTPADGDRYWAAVMAIYERLTGVAGT